MIKRRTFDLGWPRELSSGEARQLLTTLRTVNMPVLELVGGNELIAHRLLVHEAHADQLERHLSAVLPTLHLQSIERSVADFTDVRRVTRRGSFMLATDRIEAVVQQLLGVLSSLGRGEAVLLQWVFGQPLAPAVIHTDTPLPLGDSWLNALWHATYRGTRELDGAERRRLQAKWAMPSWRVTIRIAVTSRFRSRALLHDVMTALRSAEAPGAYLGLRPTCLRLVHDARAGWLESGAYNLDELVMLAGLPVGNPYATKLLRQTHRILTSRVTPTSGVPLGRTPDGALLRLPTRAASEHTAVIGVTGTGKSALLLSMALRHLSAGRGLVLLDPKGDLAADLLRRIPEDRRSDIVVLDPLDEQAVVGLNPLAAAESPELAADGVLAVFKELYGDYLGPRSQDILHAALLTLAHAGDQTLVSLPVLLTNASFRRRLLRQMAHEPVLSSFWQWFEGLSEPERTTVLAPVFNKVRPFLYRRGLRRVFGQAQPRFRLEQVFTERKALIVSLARGQLGAEGSALLGSLLVTQLWRTIERRVSVPAKRRTFVPLYLDEFSDYLHLPLDLGDALAKARGYGTGWVLAAQHLQQLPPRLRADVLANARNKVLFSAGVDDSRTFAAGSVGVLQAVDFLELPRYQAYAHLSGFGWYSLSTDAPVPASTDGEAVRRHSRMTYGQSVAELDEALTRLLDGPNDGPSAPAIGRRRQP